MQPATNSAQALQNLQSFTGGEQTPQDVISGANKSMGVDQAYQTVQGLRGAINQTTNLLNQVAPSVMGRTQNSLVTSAQADKQIGNEQAPIQTNLNQDATQYNQANSDYSNLSQRADTLANAQLTGQQNQQSYLQGIYQDLYTQEQNAAQQAEAKREFDASQALAAKNSSAGSGGSPISLGPGPGASSGDNSVTNRDAYNNSLNGLVAALNSHQAPTYETAVSQLVKQFSGKGISPQEIGDYVYQLYGRYFNTSQTKKFYG